MTERIALPLPEGTTHLTVYCGGDLSLEGTARKDLSIRYPDGDPKPRLEHTEAGVALYLASNGRVALPAGLDVTVARVEGDLAASGLQDRLRADSVPGDMSVTHCRDVAIGNVAGDLAVSTTRTLHAGQVESDVSASNVQLLTLGSVASDLALSNVESAQADQVGSDLSVTNCGDLAVGRVQGDVSVSNTYGNVTLEHVGGDLAATTFEGDLLVSDSVGGNVTIRSKVTPDQRIHLRVWGSAVLVLDGPVSLRSMTGRGKWDTLPDWEEIRSQPATTQGDGPAADVLIAAGGRMVFTAYQVDTEALTETLSQLSQELSQLAENIARQVQAGLSGADFADIRRQIREALASIDWSRLRKDVRAAERMQRKVERAMRQAERRRRKARVYAAVHQPPPVPPQREASAPEAPPGVSPTGGEQPRGGATDQERLLILKMVQEGKISPEEGVMLLDALG